MFLFISFLLSKSILISARIVCTEIFRLINERALQLCIPELIFQGYDGYQWILEKNAFWSNFNIKVQKDKRIFIVLIIYKQLQRNIFSVQCGICIEKSSTKYVDIWKKVIAFSGIIALSNRGLFETIMYQNQIKIRSGFVSC